MQSPITFSTVLTLVRLVLSPILFPVLIVYGLPFNSILINAFLAALFLLFSATDFLDGYLARRYSQVTTLGRILDPIADKFLTCSVIIALLAIGKIFFLWALILIGREIFVLSIRQLALEYQLSIPVSLMGKTKTVLQILYLTILILNPYHSLVQASMSAWVADLYLSPIWNLTELSFAALAIGLTVISAQQYYSSFVLQYLSRTR